MMMKELEESNRFKMVEERKTQGFLESICGEGRGMMIFGDGDETDMSRCPSGCNSHDYQIQPLVYELVHRCDRRRSGGLSSYFAIEFHSKSSSYQFKITTKQENNYLPIQPL
jgi:hypothetical protein